MSKVKKVKKHEDGSAITTPTQPSGLGYLPFEVEGGGRFDLEEEGLNQEILTAIEADPRLRRSKDRILSAYDNLKRSLRDGAGQGQFYTVTPAGDKALGASTNLDLTDTERGYNSRGRTARPGILSALTGISRDEVANAFLHNVISNAVARSYTTLRDEKASEEAKTKAEEEAAAKRTKAEEEAKLGQERTGRHQRAFDMFNIGQNIYGREYMPSMSGESLGQLMRTNWNRFHQDPDSQRGTAVNYLRNFIGSLGDESLTEDEDFNRLFLDRTGKTLEDFRTTAGQLNLEDPEIDLQSTFDSLGLGAQWSRFNDPTAFFSSEETQARAQKEQADAELAEQQAQIRPDDFTGRWEGDGRWYQNNELIQGDYSGLQYVDGQLLTGPSGSDFTRYQALDFGSIPMYIEGVRTGNISDWWADESNAERSPELWDTLYEGYARRDAFLADQRFSPTSGLREIRSNPYPQGQTPQDVVEYSDDTAQFPSSKRGNEYQFSVVYERTQDGNVRTRVTDSSGSYTGQITANRRGELVFRSDEENPDGSPKLVKPLGKRDTSTEVGTAATNRSMMYSWRTSGPGSVERPGQRENPGSTFTGPKYKFGGTLEKLQKGGVIQKLQEGSTVETPNRLNYNSQANIDDLQSFMSGKDQQFSSNRGVDIGLMLFGKDYKMDEADKLELGALAAEMGGLVASFIPGANVGAAVTGAASSVASHRARTLRGENPSGWSLVGNLALDTATAVPLLGAAAKTAKTASSAKKFYNMLSKAANVGSLSGGGLQIYDALGKMIDGDYSATTLRQLASGLTGAKYGGSGLTRGRISGATTRGASQTTQSIDVNVNGKSTKVDLTSAEASKLQGLKGNKAREAVRDLMVEKKLVLPTNKDQIDIDLSRFSINPKTVWSGEAPLKVKTTKGETRIKSPDETTNWYQRNRAKQIAHENPGMEGASAWLRGRNSNALRSAGSAGATEVTEPAVGPRAFSPWVEGSNRLALPASSGRPMVGTDMTVRPTPKRRPLTDTEVGLNEARRSYQSGLANKKRANQMHEQASVDAALSNLGSRPAAVSTPESRVIPASTPTPTSGESITHIPAPRVPQSITPSRMTITRQARDNFRKRLENLSRKFRAPSSASLKKGGVIKAQRGTYLDYPGQSNARFNYAPNIQPAGRPKAPILNTLAPILGDGVTFNSRFGRNQAVQTAVNIPPVRSTPTPSSAPVMTPVSNVVVPATNVTPTRRRLSVPAPATNSVIDPQLAKSVVDKLRVTPQQQTVAGTVADNLQTTEGAALSNVPSGYTPDGTANAVTPRASIKVNPYDLSEGLRALYHIASNNRIDTRVEAPLLSHVQEVSPRVTGDLLTRNAYSRAGNRLRQQAGQPYSSDATMQTASRLAAESQAADLEVQGEIANAQALRQQEAAVLDSNRAYAGSRQAVANQNVNTLANRDQAQRQLENQRRQANTHSVDSFWANQNQRGYRNQQLTAELDSELEAIKSLNAPVSSQIALDLGLSTNATYTDAVSKIQSEMDTIRFKVNKTPEDNQRLEELRALSNNLIQQSRETSIQHRRDLIGGKTLSLPRIDLSALGRGNIGTSSVRSNQKGGKVTIAQRIQLEDRKAKNKYNNDFMKDYNRWLSNKSNLQSRERIAHGAGVQELIKNTLKFNK